MDVFDADSDVDERRPLREEEGVPALYVAVEMTFGHSRHGLLAGDTEMGFGITTFAAADE
jgi:hypothetical protein